MSICTHCQAPFPIPDWESSFYKRIDVPEPKLCPTCRQIQRARFRNERNLYHNICAKTGKPLISMYKPATNLAESLDQKTGSTTSNTNHQTAPVIYDSKIWWGDDWDPLEYGQEFDFTKPFFQQFQELQLKVPRLPLYQKNCQNSEYSNHADHCKSAYLSADVGHSEDILYSKWIINCRDLTDCYQLEESEQCYESLYTVGAYDSRFVYLADQSRDSDFLYNCKNVRNSAMCWNLRNKQYYIQNKPHSKEEYEERMQHYDPGSYQKLQTYLAQYEELKQKAIRPPTVQVNCEDCSGDYLYNCKNVQESFGVIESQDSAYCYDAGHLKDCLDTYESAFECELQYQCHGCNRGKFLISCSVSYDISNSYYSEMCHNSSNLFGCIGLRQKKYCILNRQYSKVEYFAILPKIIEHMKQTGEWGQFFPEELSFFDYQESAAAEFELAKSANSQFAEQNSSEKSITADGSSPEVESKTSKDSKHEINPTQESAAHLLPDHIKETTDQILEAKLGCNTCAKPYKIIQQELKFHRAQNLALPRHCPNCRYYHRLAKRNPYKLHAGHCANCHTSIQTTYPPNAPETIYCRECYLKEIY